MFSTNGFFPHFTISRRLLCLGCCYTGSPGKRDDYSTYFGSKNHPLTLFFLPVTSTFSYLLKAPWDPGIDGWGWGKEGFLYLAHCLHSSVLVEPGSSLTCDWSRGNGAREKQAVPSQNLEENGGKREREERQGGLWKKEIAQLEVVLLIKWYNLMTTGETGSCPREDQARAPSPCSSSCLLTPHLYCPVCLPDLSLLPLFPACILPKVSVSV